MLVGASACQRKCGLAQLCFLAARPWLGLVWSGPAMGARPLADFGTAECRILTGLRQDRKLVSLSPYERRPNPHIGLPGHNGAGQNRKQDLPFSSHKEVKFAQRPARLSPVRSIPHPAPRWFWHSDLPDVNGAVANLSIQQTTD